MTVLHRLSAIPEGGQATHLHHPLQGFFNASTWLTAIAGAAVLLLAYHLATSNTGRRPAGPGPAAVTPTADMIAPARPALRLGHRWPFLGIRPSPVPRNGLSSRQRFGALHAGSGGQAEQPILA